MARNDPQVNLRIPAELKDRLDAAALENKRSLTAEVIDKIELGLRVDMLRASLNRERDRLIERAERAEAEVGRVTNIIRDLEKAEHEKFELAKRLREVEQKDKATLYVALDANGMPLSWPETMTHLGEIGRAGGFDIQNIEARVIDAKPVSSQDRDAEWWDLVQRYRKMRRTKSNGPE